MRCKHSGFSSMGQGRSISGFLLDEIGYIPEENDLQTLEFCGFRFEIQKIRDKRIEQILVTEILEPPGDSSEDSH